MLQQTDNVGRLSLVPKDQAPEECMPHPREKSPGSFRDELGGVIERVVPNEKTARVKPDKSRKQAVKDTAELNDRLFEHAWKKSGT